MKRNGNCKMVRCTTNGNLYRSLYEAAEAAGVSSSSMSYAISHKTPCKGNRYAFESDTEANVMEMGRNLREMQITREEMSEFYAWKANKEAEAKREAELAKAKAKREIQIAKAREKVERLTTKYERSKANTEMCFDMLMKAEMELESLLDEEV